MPLAPRSIEGLDEVASPALVFDRDAIDANIARMLEIAGGRPERLRPHLKTHKCAEILRLLLEAGVTDAKAATIAEAELAARAGCREVLLSYPLVGPNVGRFRQLRERYPETRFAALVDCEETLPALVASASAETPLPLFIDLDSGMHRTGIEPGEAALSLVRALVSTPGLEFAGVHAYDGHVHAPSPEDRRRDFDEAMVKTEAFLATLEAAGIVVPMVVSGGSPTFAFHAAKAAAASTPERPWQASPGTTLLWDAGYGTNVAELGFTPAALLLTRVVSHPGADRLCLDLGHKAVAGENPIDRRVRFPEMPEAEFLSQSEEHLVVRVPDRGRYPVGTALIGIPWHVCPTVALHQRARLVEGGRVTPATWEILARDRVLTV